MPLAMGRASSISPRAPIPEMDKAQQSSLCDLGLEQGARPAIAFLSKKSADNAALKKKQQLGSPRTSLGLLSFESDSENDGDVDDLAKQAPRPKILATASAFPPLVHKQQEFTEAFVRQHRLTPEDEAFVRRVFQATTIDSCRSFLPAERLFERMTREEYAAYTRPALLQLAVEAGRKVLAEFGGRAADVTHLLFCTMTGNLQAPSLDCSITKDLGLPVHVQRLNVENMGCQGGFRCLSMARDLALGRPDNVVLVVVCDLRNALGNQLVHHEDFSPIDRSTVVASSLFRDSGGATVVAHPDWCRKQRRREAMQQAAAAAALAAPAAPAAAPAAPAAAPARLGLEIVETRAELVPNTEGMAVMKERDGAAIHLYLDKELPHAVHAAIPSVIANLLASSPYPDLSPADCCYALHTGGPKVIRNVAAALGIDHELVMSSWEVMRQYGNLSGSSNLVVLDHVVRDQARFRCGKKFCIGISFGPGVSVQTVLMRFTD